MSARHVQLARRRARIAMERTPTPERRVLFRLVRSGPAHVRMKPENVAAHMRGLTDPRLDAKKLVSKLRVAGYEIHLPGVDDDKRYAAPSSIHESFTEYR